MKRSQPHHYQGSAHHHSHGIPFSPADVQKWTKTRWSSGQTGSLITLVKI